MSKWRPSDKNIYVIGDIHGKYSSLKMILSRITPLRKQDELIFLGDYIDRGVDSDKVIQKLIDLKNKYENVTFLSGNHEKLLLAALGLEEPCIPSTGGIAPIPGTLWLANGGKHTIFSYAEKKNISNRDALSISLKRYVNIIPQDHLDFLQGLYSYYDHSEYIFVHAGCDPYIELSKQEESVLLWDRSLWDFMRNNKNANVSWDKPIVCGHNYYGPFYNPKYIMLDASGTNRVVCAELNSMTAYVSEYGRDRMVFWDLRSI
jgi:serine/threonine protein phosphatase 1